MLLTNVAFAQTDKTKLLTNKIWKIKSDEMSGVGLHTSLADNTELQFFDDGTWKSSQPIKENTTGTWKLENNRTLVMTIGNEEPRYLLIELTKSELQYRLKKNAATYTFAWFSEE
jgi:hypothetical protein